MTLWKFIQSLDSITRMKALLLVFIVWVVLLAILLFGAWLMFSFWFERRLRKEREEIHSQSRATEEIKSKTCRHHVSACMAYEWVHCTGGRCKYHCEMNCKCVPRPESGQPLRAIKGGLDGPPQPKGS